MSVISTYSPKDFESGKYTGTVSLRMPTYVERIALMRDVDVCGDDNLLRLMVMAKALPAHFAGADITRTDDGAKFSTWADIESESGLSNAVTEMTLKLLGEARVGAKTS